MRDVFSSAFVSLPFVATREGTPWKHLRYVRVNSGILSLLKVLVWKYEWSYSVAALQTVQCCEVI